MFIDRLMKSCFPSAFIMCKGCVQARVLIIVMKLSRNFIQSTCNSHSNHLRRWIGLIHIQCESIQCAFHVDAMNSHYFVMYTGLKTMTVQLEFVAVIQKLCLMLSVTYYAQNYAAIISWSLPIAITYKHLYKISVFLVKL